MKISSFAKIAAGSALLAMAPVAATRNGAGVAKACAQASAATGTCCYETEDWCNIGGGVDHYNYYEKTSGSCQPSQT